MATARIIPTCLVLLLPASALAHGAGGHPADPNLHVDASLEDCSVVFSSELSQSAFARFAREFGGVGAFKQASPPTTLGQWGFALDIEQIFFSVEDKSDAWNDTFAHPDEYHELGASQAFPKLRLRFGVTDDLDIGAFYSENPRANYGWFGVEAKYGILKQSEDMPIALAVRGAYTKTLYVDDMDMHALGIDVTVGRTFFNVVTPYLGVGTDSVLVRETSDAVELDTEAVSAPHLTGGVEVRYWHVALGAEAQLAAVPSVQAQVSAVF
jgi:hypothetical protein